MKKNLFLFLLSTLLTINSFAQDTSNVNRNCFWLELGAGFVENTNYSMIGSSTWFHASHNNTLFTFRYQNSVEYLALFISPVERAKSYALMAGKLRTTKYIQLSASAGLGLSKGVYRGEYLYSSGGWFISSSVYESKVYQIVNIPFEFDFVFKPIPLLGLGISVTGDLNPKQSTLGVYLKAGIGLYPTERVLKFSK